MDKLRLATWKNTLEIKFGKYKHAQNEKMTTEVVFNKDKSSELENFIS